MLSVRTLLTITSLVFLCKHAFVADLVESIHDFGANTAKGSFPKAEPIVGADGFLYASTSSGGKEGAGTVFRIASDGSGYKILHHFLSSQLDGSFPLSALVEASNGYLYGTTQRGGRFGFGTVFRMKNDGTEYNILHSFDSVQGRFPEAPLTESAGSLYGTAAYGGTRGSGTLYSLKLDGSDFSVLRNFDKATDGSTPRARVIVGSDGALYGTLYDGKDGVGAVYKVQKNGTAYQTLKSFDNVAVGSSPCAALLEGQDGMLYGSTEFGGRSNFGTFFRLEKTGANFQLIKNLDNHFEARMPRSAFVQGTNGTLYAALGASSTIISIKPDGSDFKVLKSFDFEADGIYTYPGVVLGPGSLLYGLAETGGPGRAGTLYRVSTRGSDFSILTAFSFGDGLSPNAALVSPDGYIYGMTKAGGTAGRGTIYRLKQDGSSYEVLYSFLGWDGFPSIKLLEGSDGLLYGADTQTPAPGGQGAIFRIAKDGKDFQKLQLLSRSDNGTGIETLIEGSDGMLYGTASSDGPLGNGTIFKMNKDGSSFLLLKKFSSGSDGFPGPLIQGSDSRLYGVAGTGGSNGFGAVFSLHTDGSNYTVIKDLDADIGFTPTGIMEASDGRLYISCANSDVSGGTLIGMDKDGGNFSVLTEVGRSGLYFPVGPLIEDPDGWLIGTTSSVLLERGSLFQIKKDGKELTVLNTFMERGPNVPRSGVGRNSAGALFGTVEFGGAANAGAVYRAVRNISIAIEAGNNQQVFTNTQPATPLQIKVRDGNGARVANARVRFELQPIETGTFSSANSVYPDFAVVLTNENGIATAPSFTAPGKIGIFKVHAALVDAPTVKTDFALSTINFDFTPAMIVENSPIGTAVGTLSALPGVTYSLASGEGSSGNGLVAIDGNEISNAVVLNHEESSTLRFRVRATGTGGNIREMSFEVPVADVNEPPTLLSDLVITPNPVLVGQPIVITAIAADPEGSALSLTFDYGDGTLGTQTTHTYSTPQIYTVTATFSDGTFNVASSVALMVMSASNPGLGDDPDGDGVPNSIDTDDDGDGISDAMESLAGTDPMNNTSTPLKNGTKAPATPAAVEKHSLQINLNFAKLNSDSIKFKGRLVLQDPVESKSPAFIVDVGGVMRLFTVRKNGAIKAGNDSFKIFASARDRTALPVRKFAMTLRKGSFASTLADEQLTNESVSARSVEVPVVVVFDGQYYRSALTLNYKANQGKTGSAKN